MAVTAPKWSGGVPSSGTFYTGEATARVLDVFGLEFNTRVVPTCQRGCDQGGTTACKGVEHNIAWT